MNERKFASVQTYTCCGYERMWAGIFDRIHYLSAAMKPDALPKAITDYVCICTKPDTDVDIETCARYAANLFTRCFNECTKKDLDFEKNFIALFELGGENAGWNPLMKSFLRHVASISAEVKVASAVVIVDMQNDFVPVDSGYMVDGNIRYGAAWEIVDGIRAYTDASMRHRSARKSAFAPEEYKDAKDMEDDYVKYVKVINRIRELLARRGNDFFVFSMDYHPPDHISFADNKQSWMDNLKGVGDRSNHEKTERYPVHCVQGTWGQQIIGDLRYSTHVVEKINNGTADYVLKGDISDKEGYSSFFRGKGVVGNERSPTQGTEAFRQLSTGLHEKLQERNIRRLYLCGVAQNICVCDTARDAVALGYEVYFVDDACKPLILESYNDFIKSPTDTVTYLRSFGVKVCSVDDVIADSNDKCDLIVGLKSSFERGSRLRKLPADINSAENKLSRKNWAGQ